MKQNTEKFFHEPDFMKVLERVAGKILHKSSVRGISIKNIFGESLSDPSKQEFKEILVSEICRFLLENAGEMEKALSRSGNNMGVCLEKLFYRHVLDRARHLDSDPFRYLYKFVTDMMREKPDRFFLFPEGKRGSSYALSENSRPVGPVATEDLKDIPFPHDMSITSDFDKIRTRKDLEPLLVYFWENLCQKFGDEPIRVQVRDFVSWFALNIPITRIFCSLTGSPQHSATAGMDSQSLENSMDMGSAVSISPLNKLEIQRTHQYAQLFANRLKPKEKEFLILRLGRDMDLKSMAKELGYKGPSGPASLMNSIALKIKKFLRDLPWLCPEDLDQGGQEVFLIFLEQLIIILKNADPTPYEK